ncbi:MAG: RNA-directed DNA polymerase [Prevotella sp.]|jgi:hypothetical protein|nr:RNA-directed DNA polymerase [Prevotella sp.]MCH3994850.1 RNA-directed DNA polymerase [Prevotella sp.]
MINLENLLQAYFVCRRGKRRTASAIEYEMDYVPKLIELRDRVNCRTYAPGKSICFVVTRPRYREVFAAAFEDRIIHHYIAIRLEPLFERAFNDRTFNCRKDKGQLYGVECLKNDMRECSRDYKTDCYCMTLDIKGFFMSIGKSIMASMIDDFVVSNYNGEDKEDLRFLCKAVIMHEPQKNCIRKSPDSLWSHIPKEKSLFTNGKGKGLAIGNLFSQLFANFYLNRIDWLIEKYGTKYHGRYVDDMYCISTDKERLLNLVPIIRKELSAIGLRLNTKKFYFQHCSKGVPFTGAVVKPGRVYAMNRTIGNLRSAIGALNHAKAIGEIKKCVNSINSYLGLLGHYNEYANRRKVLDMIDDRLFNYIYIKGHYKCLALRDEYKTRTQIIRRIANGEL